MSDDVRKVVIIGSGPAGWTAALYTARGNLHPLVYEGTVPNTPGGQLMITSDVENYPGFPEGVQGPDLMDKFKAQAVRFGAETVQDNVVRVDFSKRPYVVETESSGSVKARTVIISTGANAKLLGIEKEDLLMSTGGGVSACATCDGALFRDMEVCVVGGGDTAMEDATFLTRFATKVTLIHRRDELRASKIMGERAQKNEKIVWKLNKVVEEILTTEVKGPIGTREEISGLILKDTQTGETEEYATQGLFVAIGHKPNTDLFRDWLELDDAGYLTTEGKSARTKLPGVYACGDVQDSEYRQAITAAGSGCMAALDAERFLEHEDHEQAGH
jgi:thioredoxin reductase (NADPH)